MNFGAIAWGGIILLGVVDGGLVVAALIAMSKNYRQDH